MYFILVHIHLYCIILPTRQGCPSLFTVSIPRLQQPSDNLVNKLVITKTIIYFLYSRCYTHIPRVCHNWNCLLTPKNLWSLAYSTWYVNMLTISYAFCKSGTGDLTATMACCKRILHSFSPVLTRAVGLLPVLLILLVEISPALYY